MSARAADGRQSDPQSTTRKKPSSAAVVAAQLRAKKELNKNLVPLVQTRVERSFDLITGETKLNAIFPRKNGLDPDTVDLSFMLPFCNLAPMFAEAYKAWGAPCAPSTRQTTAALLKIGFFKYLEFRQDYNLRPDEIDDELLSGFREYLLTNVGANGKPSHPSYVRSLLGVVRYVLDALESGIWVLPARRIVERVPPGPVGSHRKTEPTEVLGFEQLISIIDAAEKEVLAIESRFSRGRELVAQGRANAYESSGTKDFASIDYSDLAVCLAELDTLYPSVIPDLEVVVRDNPRLGAALQYIHGHRDAYSYLVATGRDLVPFVLLLCIATVFNVETVLALKWADIDFDRDRAGTPVIAIQGVKGRAAENPFRLLDPEAAISSKLSLKRLLLCLKDITVRIRPMANAEIADCLFLYISQSCGKEPKSFGGGNAGGYSIWRYSHNNFILANGLENFVLGQLRPTILDLVQFMDGSLEAAQRVGNHKSPLTTWKYYTSGGVKKRYRERIGEVIVLRERWLESEGRIDPRRILPEQDKGSATPGFTCLNPFDSPRPNQQRGKLCKDYGGCPSCPMAAAFPTDPTSVGYYRALALAIYKSQQTMSARTWLERWAPILSDLTALLALVPPEVLEASKKISFKLPNVG